MKYLLGFAILCFCMYIQAEEGEEDSREGRISIFNVVKFPNDACDAGGNKTGTCYTSEECTNLRGESKGECADGFGVCCTFTARCGDEFSVNNTYFESTGNEKGACTVKICPIEDLSIVQLRLDFETFNIAGPSGSATTVQTVSNNVVLGTGGVESNFGTVCLDDTFAVSNPDGQSPPVICGNNNGMHMYVDASENCNALTFTLSDTGRSWRVRVTQYEAGFENLAPAGCTQYFWNKEDSNGVLSSYNYGGGRHLADQKQVICIRREENKARICYSVDNRNDIAISGLAEAAVAPNCGGYNTAGTLTYADALLIPMASTGSGASLVNGNFCGQGNSFVGNVASGEAESYSQVCSSSVPFRLTFVSDTFEGLGGPEWTGATPNNEGFRIRYEQS